MLDQSCRRLWAAYALAQLTIPTELALGRALHSPDLTGPPPWPGVRLWDAPGEFATGLRARGSDHVRSTSPRPPGTAPPAKASMPTASGAASARLARVDRSPRRERLRCREPPDATFEHTVSRSAKVSAAGGCEVVGTLRSLASSVPMPVTTGCSAPTISLRTDDRRVDVVLRRRLA